MKERSIFRKNTQGKSKINKTQPSLGHFYKQQKVNRLNASRVKKSTQTGILKTQTTAAFDADEVEVVHTQGIARCGWKPFQGSCEDVILDACSLGYSIRSNDNFTKREVFDISQKHLKDVLLNDLSSFTDDCYVVQTGKAGEVSPYFIPDFADLAMLPLPLKVAFKHMILSNNSIPAEVKGIWESCGPSLPKVRPSCTIRETGVEIWKCYSNASKVQLLTVAQADRKTIFFSATCASVSSNILDGRTYFCTAVISANVSERHYGYYHKEANILMWNCQGVGRPSFVSHFAELKKKHMPDIMVLLETRGSKMEVQSQLANFDVYRFSAMATNEYYGGVVILSMRPDVTYDIIDNQPDHIYGYVRGIQLTQ